MRRTLLLLSLLLCACTAQVSDLDDLEVNEEACDPTGDFVQGTDLDIQFMGLTPHVNQDMFFAITDATAERNIEAIMVLSTFDDANLHLVVPGILPGRASELAFWADSMPTGMFNPINDDDDPIDHQWTRPICPDGKLTFVHTPTFQSVKDATSTGAVFRFMIPDELNNDDLFNEFHMTVRAILLDDNDASEEVQTRAFYRWAPHVGIDGDDQPDRMAPAFFQVGGNALGERRGPIDQLALYRIEFVIDVDKDGEKSGADFVCSFEREQAPDANEWEFEPDLSQCDPPDGFDPATFVRD